MNKILTVLVLAVLLATMSGCSFNVEKKADDTGQNMVRNAIIRYFDGSSEMVEVTDVYPRDGYVIIDTVYGQRIRMGWNNVILVDESADEWDGVQ